MQPAAGAAEEFPVTLARAYDVACRDHQIQPAAVLIDGGLVDVHSHSFGDAQAVALAAAIRGNDCVVSDVSVRQTSIGKDGVEALCEALKRSARSEPVALTLEDVAADVAEVLADLVRTCNVQDLRIAHTNLPAGQDDAWLDFCDAAAASGSLRVLHLRRCRLEDDHIAGIGKVIGRSPGLAEVSLEQNAIGDAGIRMLVGSVERSQSLTTLSVDNTLASATAVRDLRAVLQERTRQPLLDAERTYPQAADPLEDDDERRWASRSEAELQEELCRIRRLTEDSHSQLLGVRAENEELQTRLRDLGAWQRTIEARMEKVDQRLESYQEDQVCRKAAREFLEHARDEIFSTLDVELRFEDGVTLQDALRDLQTEWMYDAEAQLGQYRAARAEMMSQHADEMRQIESADTRQAEVAAAAARRTSEVTGLETYLRNVAKDVQRRQAGVDELAAKLDGFMDKKAALEDALVRTREHVAAAEEQLREENRSKKAAFAREARARRDGPPPLHQPEADAELRAIEAENDMLQHTRDDIRSEAQHRERALQRLVDELLSREQDAAKEPVSLTYFPYM
eukprot:TRINITY_DN27970_c0_g1_i1.p1 TRINITY_DN27970_c0_g1~~TRINITY_DN27970_c0_g1_i1.p1  ORF type:complete len:568 (+),score=216.17 TRINITY_DN27970_c0_g1_i1:91-1794(+)